MTLPDSLGEELPSGSCPRGRELRRLSFRLSSGNFFIFMERLRTGPGDLVLLRTWPFLWALGLWTVNPEAPALSSGSTLGTGTFPEEENYVRQVKPHGTQKVLALRKEGQGHHKNKFLQKETGQGCCKGAICMRSKKMGLPKPHKNLGRHSLVVAATVSSGGPFHGSGAMPEQGDPQHQPCHSQPLFWSEKDHSLHMNVFRNKRQKGTHNS